MVEFNLSLSMAERRFPYPFDRASRGQWRYYPFDPHHPFSRKWKGIDYQQEIKIVGFKTSVDALLKQLPEARREEAKAFLEHYGDDPQAAEIAPEEFFAVVAVSQLHDRLAGMLRTLSRHAEEGNVDREKETAMRAMGVCRNIALLLVQEGANSGMIEAMESRLAMRHTQLDAQQRSRA